MAARWVGIPIANPVKVASAYLVHPMGCNWQDSIVSGWASAHPGQVKRGESATEWEALRKQHEQEVRDGIKRAGQRSKAVWDYLDENYETIFGEKNQVKK